MPESALPPIGFLHGREGNTQGSKATWMRARYRLTCPAYPTDTLAHSLSVARQAVRDAAALHPDERPRVWIGSSWGGRVLHELVQEGTWRGPVVLLAPALRPVEAGDPGPSFGVPLQGVVIHGRGDDIVDPAVSTELLAHAPTMTLISVDDDHRLGTILQNDLLAAAIALALHHAR
jgi:hypothetical protein